MSVIVASTKTAGARQALEDIDQGATGLALVFEGAPNAFGYGLPAKPAEIPKLQACAEAVEGGVGSAHMIDGRDDHGILIELFTDSGIGTMICAASPDSVPPER